MRVHFVRAPYTSGYNTVDVREDAIITYASSYLRTAGVTEIEVSDFHLDQRVSLRSLQDSSSDVFIFSIRESGANVHYAERLAIALRESSGRPILLYGQTGRLNELRNLKDNFRILPHDERALATALGVPDSGKSFSDGLVAEPYIQQLPLDRSQMRRRRASLESSRGCHYKCDFCFINHGHNYPTRWQLRPINAILADVDQYASIDIKSVVFHDSEFLGADANGYLRHRHLLAAFKSDFSTTRFMIYARADTLIRFSDYELLARSGVAHIFIGVESLANSDLRALRKGITAEQVITAVRNLHKVGISTNLSFMIFNRNTTVATLRENITNLKSLCHNETRYLGMPNFLFSFESSWDAGELNELSEATYLRWMIWKRRQPSGGAVFNANLEPLAEICRLGFYELACKITSCNLARDISSDADLEKIEYWFEGLWPFSVAVLEVFVDQFASGFLTIKDLPRAIQDLYDLMASYFRCLPVALQVLETFSVHARSIMNGGISIPCEDHGWDHRIPGGVHTEGLSI